MSGSNYFASSGHTLGTIIADHPALKGFPNDGYCDFNFAGLLWEAPALRLNAWPVRVDPIVL